MDLLKQNSLSFEQHNLVDLLQQKALYQSNDTAYIFLLNGENESIRLTYRGLIGNVY